MLFCGDELRQKNQNLDLFSILLQEWLEKMGASLVFGMEDNDSNKFVSFIQVCRNYIRLDPGQIAAKSNFLKELYESGSAMYTFTGAVECDLVVPIQSERSSHQPSRKRERALDDKPSQSMLDQDTHRGTASRGSGNSSLDSQTDSDMQDSKAVDDAMDVDSITPVPQPKGDEYWQGMLVSVKNREEFSTTQMGQCLASMARQLLAANLQNGSCLLLLLGMKEDNPLDDEESKNVADEMQRELRRCTTRATRSSGNLDKLTQSSITCYVVIVEKEDRYGVGKAVACTRSHGGERAEMYASHCVLSQVADLEHIEKRTFQRALRRGT